LIKCGLEVLKIYLHVQLNSSCFRVLDDD
jgi:hypothetical protein